MTQRFWVGGPCVENDKEVWLSIDGHDLPGQRPARKPPGYQEQWPTEEACRTHCDKMNEMEERWC